jgi:hypothetical protein
MKFPRFLGLLLLASFLSLPLITGCETTSTNMASSSNTITDPAVRARLYPESDQWVLPCSGGKVREAVVNAISDLGVGRVQFDSVASPADYEGIVGATTPLGHEKVLIQWQTIGENRTALEIRRPAGPRTYLPDGLTTQIFKRLGLNRAEFPALTTQPSAHAAR